MSEFDVAYETGDDYGSLIILNKYGDRYSLICGRKSAKAEGTPWKDWCFPQDKDKKPKAKAIPMGVRLGNLTDARQFAHWLLDNLDPSSKAEPNDDDTPF